MEIWFLSSNFQKANELPNGGTIKPNEQTNGDGQTNKPTKLRPSKTHQTDAHTVRLSIRFIYDEEANSIHGRDHAYTVDTE